MKFVFVSGGVVSGLGKGVTSASIGLLLNSKGIKSTNVKVDMYLNIDAGTIRPQEHGEVFVLEDGMETDQDMGNYERFSGQTLRKENYITTGQIYKAVIDRERAFGYEGEDVEAVPHVTDEIIKRFEEAGKATGSEVVIIELGGTVGEYQNILFFEANRILKLRNPKDVVHLHVTYLPFLKNIGELKSKPAQQSTHTLNGMGIQPDFIIARSEHPIDDKRKEKLAVFCNLPKENIIANPDLPNVYRVPLFLSEQKLAEKIIEKLEIKKTKANDKITKWKNFVTKCETSKSPVNIAMVGKYFVTGDYKLSDSYISVIEALKQAAWTQGKKAELTWIDSTEYEKGKTDLSVFDGIVVPQGWGSRGVEGKIKAVRFARENKIPYLGLCFGLQMSVIEFGRNVLGIKKCNSMEVDPKTPDPIIYIMPDQVEYLKKMQYGGTIRLGSWPCKIKQGTKLWEIYNKFGKEKSAPWNNGNGINTAPKGDKDIVYERHRHRYEVNNDYRDKLERAGFVVSGTTPDGKLVEAMEIEDHPFFIGTQFHPEYIARPLTPHPIFMGFIEAAKK